MTSDESIVINGVEQEGGSRSVAYTYGGEICPDSANFGYVHGPSPSVATLSHTEAIDAPMGSDLSLQVGVAQWRGFVIQSTKTLDTETGETYSIRAHDWRDRLHDVWFFAAFNMHEDDGRVWHMPEHLWENQTKVYISKELSQVDIDDLQFFEEDIEDPAYNDLLENLLGESYISAASIIEILGLKHEFIWAAEERVFEILDEAVPMNMDWISGVKVVDALQQVLESCGLQFTIYGEDVIMITLRGWTSEELVNQYMAGLDDPCIWGANQISTGKELNMKGRRVLLVGGKNTQQWTYPCRQNWNANWDWQLCYGGWQLSAFLKTNFNSEGQSLTRWSKIKELPEEYHDHNLWSDGVKVQGEGAVDLKRTRMEMTVQEYIDKVAWKVYIVDPNWSVSEMNPAPELNTDFDALGEEPYYNTILQKMDKETLVPENTYRGTEATVTLPGDPQPESLDEIDDVELALFPVEEWDDSEIESNIDNGFTGDYNFSFPVYNKLNTDTNLKMLPYIATRRILGGMESALDRQVTVVPVTKGVTITEEEVIDPKTHRSVFRLRLVFSNAQFWIDEDMDFRKMDSRKADRIVVTLAHGKDMYTHEAGEEIGAVFDRGPGPEQGFQQNARIRTQKHNIPTLHKAFVDGGEYNVLAENFRLDLENGGSEPAVRPINADAVAGKISHQLLFHDAINRTGYMEFDETTGTLPDGMIESVSVRFSATNGITERVNYTGEEIDDNLIRAPFRIGASRLVNDLEDINRDILNSVLPLISTKVLNQASKKDSTSSDLGISDTSTEERRMIEFNNAGADKAVVEVKLERTHMQMNEALAWEGIVKHGVVVIGERNRPKEGVYLDPRWSYDIESYLEDLQALYDAEGG
jgi:hypothetical protein